MTKIRWGLSCPAPKRMPFWAWQALPLFLFFFACFACPARAQLAKNFYYVNRIESRVLPNAVQIIIRTDGVVQFGVDLNEVFDRDANGRFLPRRTTRLRLRFLKARSKLPAFNEVGAYPVDGAYVSPGRDELQSPFLSASPNPDDPSTDVELRFYVPILLQKINPFGASGDIGTDDEEARGGYNFTDVLDALGVGIELGRDRRSVVITVISDRVGSLQTPSLRRAPQKINRRLNITAADAPGAFRFDILHNPLRRVLDTAARITQTTFIVRPDSAETDITLLLPSATPREFLEILARAYSLSFNERPPPEGEKNGAWEIGHGVDLDVTQRLVLNHIAPERARLLFPDFLLPRLRVDAENNALLATGSPFLIERITKSIALLDVPRPQVKVEASAWEISSGASFDLAMSAAFNSGDSRLGGALNLGTGEAALVINKATAKSLSATLTALQTQNHAKLLAKPFMQIASGEKGLLFSGQNRFVTLLRRVRGQQTAQALDIQIGFSLGVAPLVGGREKDAEILLHLTPEISSVVEIEDGSGLPTLALRNVDTTVRLRPGDAVILAGLESQFDSEVRRGLFAPLPARRDAKGQTALIFLVTVERVD